MNDQPNYRYKLQLDVWLDNEHIRYKTKSESDELIDLRDEIPVQLEAALHTCLGVYAPSTDKIAVAFSKDHELPLFTMLYSIRDFANHPDRDLLEAIQIHVDWNKLNPNPNERELNAKQQATNLGALTLNNQETQP